MMMMKSGPSIESTATVNKTQIHEPGTLQKSTLYYVHCFYSYPLAVCIFVYEFLHLIDDILSPYN